MNDLLGEDESLVNVGAYYNNELISVITFNQENEILRFSTIRGYNECDIFPELLSYFIKKYQPKQIISYADRRWSNGNVYEKNGFIKISDGMPNYWYMPTYDIRIHRNIFNKQYLSTNLPIYDETLTEWENMQLNGYDRIWDCGNFKYEKGS